MSLKKWLYKKQTTEYKSWWAKAIQLIIFHNLSRYIFFAFFAIIGAIGTNFAFIETISNYIMLFGLIGLVIQGSIFIIYAWIINPFKKIIK